MTTQQANLSSDPHRRSSRKAWLRLTLRRSQQEAVASSAMSATSDNFFNAFALFLGASLLQMGWVSGLPQLFGAFSQLLSVWIASYYRRRHFIVLVASAQTLVVVGLAALAALSGSDSVWVFITLAMLYQCGLNLIQPHWRAWMGSLVPPRRRGTFFAARTRLSMLASLAVFLLGGGILSVTTHIGMTWLGFSLLFGAAAIGRLVSAKLLWHMHDPDPHHPRVPGLFTRTVRQYREAMKDRTFRQYSLFIASMNAMVAISAPFFAVYMLQNLQFTYFEYVLTNVVSVATQFVTLGYWGRFSDRYGNRLVIRVTSCLLPFLPLLWVFSSDFIYILAIQAISGFCWAGFSLSTANYLYDIRPFRTDFASYAALQSSLSAAFVFVGALTGGIIAAQADVHISSLNWHWLSEAVFVVFISSSLLRALVTLWFVPRLIEPHVRPRPKLLKIIFRVRGFNAISGLVLDWLTVVRRKNGD